MDKVGFVMCLLGCAGMAEAYGSGRQMSISLILLCLGGLLIFVGDIKHDTENYRRNANSNILDRLYFLKK